MLSRSLVITQKEIVDSLRDRRAIVSSLMYALMGPAVILMVALGGKAGSGDRVLPAMMSIFALVAAFVGGMNIAMDTIAGERERRSLLPLLLNPISRFEILIGKWLAVGLFSVAGLAINLIGFAGVRSIAGLRVTVNMIPIILGVMPLALFAASLQIAISTVTRNVKEAQTYLSMVVFVPMGLGMFLVFFPAAALDWGRILPLTGQQMLLELLMRGQAAGWVRPLLLGITTLVLGVMALAFAADRLHRDEIVLGN